MKAEHEEAGGPGASVAHGFAERARHRGGVLETAAGVVEEPERLKQLHLTPQQASNMLLACAKVPYDDDAQLLHTLMGVFVELPGANSQELAITV